MRLLAKKPADRPASAEAVVEAIKSIERELLAQRQYAELSAATPLSANVGSRKPAHAEFADEPNAHQASAKPRSGHRTIWIVAAVLATAAAAAVCGLVFAAAHQHPLRTADRARFVPVEADRAGRPLATASPRAAPRARREASPDYVRPRDHPDVVPRKSAPPLVTVQGASASVTPGQAAPVRPGRRDSPAASISLTDHAPTASAAQDEDRRKTDRPEWQIPGEKRTQGERSGQTRSRADWGDPIDPDGDCSFGLDGREDRIRIAVPGTPHVLSAELGRMNAPRILREVIGDFDATVRVAGAFHPAGSRTVKEYTPYHGAGILLWQDADNYVRLEIAADLQHGKVRPYANFELRKDGALAVSRGLKIEDGASHLRLRRRGDEISAAVSNDGLIWKSLTPLSAKLKERLSIGVSAINTATKPLTVELEGFDVSERPGASSDGINP